MELTTDELRLVLLALRQLRLFLDNAEESLGANVHMPRAAAASLSFKVDQALLAAMKAAQQKTCSSDSTGGPVALAGRLTLRAVLTPSPSKPGTGQPP